MALARVQGILSRRWVRIASLYLISLVAIYFVVSFLVPKSSEIAAISKVLNDAQSWQIVVAVVLELGSISAFALSTWSLVRRRPRVTRRWMIALTMASTAIGNSLPLGAGVTTVYAYRKLVRRGVSRRESGVAIGAANVIAIATLAFLTVFFTIVGEDSGTASGSVSLLTLVGLGALVLVCGLVLWKIEPIARASAAAWVYGRTRIGGPARDARNAARMAYARRDPLDLPMKTLARSVGYGLGNWGLDLSALFVALFIARAHVSILGVISAYVIGALAANLPITPGGLGVVEGSLAVSLVAFGGAQVQVLAGVLIYRLVSFWIWLPLGWISHFTLAFLERREGKGAASAVETVDSKEQC